MVTFTGNLVGDTTTYTCDVGFEMVGSETATCTQVDVNSGVFLPAPPVCRREYCMNRTVQNGYMTSQLCPYVYEYIYV